MTPDETLAEIVRAAQVLQYCQRHPSGTRYDRLIQLATGLSHIERTAREGIAAAIDHHLSGRTTDDVGSDRCVAGDPAGDRADRVRRVRQLMKEGLSDGPTREERQVARRKA